MRFSQANESRSEIAQLRVTPSEQQFLKDEAARRETNVAGLLREALDLWLAANQPSAGGARGARESGSTSTPSGVTPNVKAAGKPSKKTKH